MTEEHLKPESLEPRDLMMMGLGGAKLAVTFGDPEDIRHAAMKLMLCHNHHFAVVGEGMTLVMSHLAVECLRRARMLPTDKAYVYEGDGR